MLRMISSRLPQCPKFSSTCRLFSQKKQIFEAKQPKSSGIAPPKNFSFLNPNPVAESAMQRIKWNYIAFLAGITYMSYELTNFYSAYSLVKFPVEFEKGTDADLLYYRESMDWILSWVGSKITDKHVEFVKENFYSYKFYLHPYTYFEVKTHAEDLIITEAKRLRDVEKKNRRTAELLKMEEMKSRVNPDSLEKE